MTSATQLLRIELGVLATLAVLLLVIPAITIRVAGLPPAASNFWPRLFGGAVAGLIIATIAGDQGWTRSGIGLGAFIAINLTLAFTLASILVAGQPVPTRRGRVVLWVLTVVLAALGFVQIAYAT